MCRAWDFLNRKIKAMKIYNDSDTTISIDAQQEILNGLATMGYQGESVNLQRTKTYEDSTHYAVWDEEEQYILFYIDDSVTSATIYEL